MKKLAIVLLIVSGVQAQQSAALKKFTNYLPSLTEIGFITGSVNCYLQAATLVRTVNHEIALAKTLGDRMDALQKQAKDMYGAFQDLAEINPYDMDSWANWLMRADNLNGYEMGQFTYILSNQILTTVDQKMTQNFYHDIQRARSYEVKDGNFKDVIERYYMRTHYVNYDERTRQAAINNVRVLYTSHLTMLQSLRSALDLEADPVKAKALRKMIAFIEPQLTHLEKEMREPAAIQLTSTDKQIQFVADVAQGLSHDFEMIQTMLYTHQQNLIKLNSAWRETAEGRIPKDKRTTGTLSAITPSRDLYDPTDADKVPIPDNNSEKPTQTNVSHTGSPTNMGDILFLQNKIDFERLAIAQTGLLMDLMTSNAKATFLAVEAGKNISATNVRSSATFGAENFAQSIRKRL